jgi:type I restriction enzyme S subunit
MGRVDEVICLRSGAQKQTGALPNAALGDVERGLDVARFPLGELILESRNGRSIKSSGDIGNGSVLTLTAVRTPIADLEQRKTIVLDDAIGKQFAVRRGDVFVSRANTIELVGLSAIVECRPPVHLIFPDLLIRLRADEQRIRPKYLAYALRFPGSRRQIRERAVGSSQSMVKISGERLREVMVPLPDLAVQDRVVCHLDGLLKLATALEEKLVAESARDTLLPAAILRKAFAGEL